MGHSSREKEVAARQILSKVYLGYDQHTVPDGDWKDKQAPVDQKRRSSRLTRQGGDAERIRNGGGPFDSTRALLTTSSMCVTEKLEIMAVRAEPLAGFKVNQFPRYVYHANVQLSSYLVFQFLF